MERFYVEFSEDGHSWEKGYMLLMGEFDLLWRSGDILIYGWGKSGSWRRKWLKRRLRLPDGRPLRVSSI